MREWSIKRLFYNAELSRFETLFTDKYLSQLIVVDETGAALIDLNSKNVVLEIEKTVFNFSEVKLSQQKIILSKFPELDPNVFQDSESVWKQNPRDNYHLEEMKITMGSPLLICGHFIKDVQITKIPSLDC
jgi:hypothetical protein